MSQILTFNYKYIPKYRDWSTVQCKDWNQFLSYVRENSIIILTRDEMNDTEFERKIRLTKGVFSNVSLLVLDSTLKSGLWTNLREDELEEKIQEIIKGRFEKKDKTAILRELFTDFTGGTDE